MKIKKPNIHIFVEHKKYYLYDVNINAVVTIPYELYEFFFIMGKKKMKKKLQQTLKKILVFLWNRVS